MKGSMKAPGSPHAFIVLALAIVCVAPAFPQTRPAASGGASAPARDTAQAAPPFTPVQPELLGVPNS